MKLAVPILAATSLAAQDYQNDALMRVRTMAQVLDREEAGRVPFFKEQVRIKEILRKEKVKLPILQYAPA